MDEEIGGGGEFLRLVYWGFDKEVAGWGAAYR